MGRIPLCVVIAVENLDLIFESLFVGLSEAGVQIGTGNAGAANAAGDARFSMCEVDWHQEAESERCVVRSELCRAVEANAEGACAGLGVADYGEGIVDGLDNSKRLFGRRAKGSS